MEGENIVARMAQSNIDTAYTLLEQAKNFTTDNPANPFQAIDGAELDMNRTYSITSVVKRMARSWVDIALVDNKLDKTKHSSYTPLECRLILSLAQYVGEELNRG
jgi:hypothetical protein